jgi:hypothetical protein
MHVHVDKSRRHDPARPMFDRNLRISAMEVGVRAGRLNALAALFIGTDNQQTVFFKKRLTGKIES